MHHAVQLEAYCKHFMRKHGVQFAPAVGDGGEPSKHEETDSKDKKTATSSKAKNTATDNDNNIKAEAVVETGSPVP